MKKTKIEWADSTWNPVTGCYHMCKYCYAKKIAERFGGFTESENPPETRTTIIGDEYLILHEVYSMQARREKNGKFSPAIYPYGFEPTFHKYRLNEPEQWTKPRNIFVCSMADLFGDWVPDHWIQAVFDACDAAPQHRYMFLTKNPKRLCQLANEKKLPIRDNWWFGSTVDNAQARIYPGRLQDHTFVSMEPLLEEMDVGLGSFGSAEWLILGAETGNRKGKVVPKKEWIDKICKVSGFTHMSVFMKDSLLPIVNEENMRREFPWDHDCPKNRHMRKMGWMK